jgi:hypothetical protein
MFSILLLIPTASAQASSQEKCAAKKPFETAIDIKFVNPPPTYVYDRSIKSITKYSGQIISKWNDEQGGGVFAPKMSHALGLTIGKMGFRFESLNMSRSTSLFGSDTCIYAKNLTVEVFYSSEIYVASEYKKGTCKHKVTLEHEHKHHNANISAVKAHVETLKKDMPEIVTYLEQKSISNAGAQDASNKLQAGFHDALNFYTKQVKAIMEQKNSQIDTPEEYARAGRVCVGGKRLRLW